MTALPLALTGAALLVAVLAVVASLLSWRAATRLSERVDLLAARLREPPKPPEIPRPDRAADESARLLTGLRDDIAVLFAHVSALTSGQLDLRQTVAASVERHLAPLLDRLDEADSRAERRATLLRQRVELVREALQDVADDLTTQGGVEAAASAALARLETDLTRMAETLAALNTPAFPARPRQAAPFEPGHLSIVAPARRDADA